MRVERAPGVGNGRVDDVRRRHPLPLGPHRPRVDARHVEDVVEQVIQPVELAERHLRLFAPFGVRRALREIADRLVVLTWLDRADRSVLRTHPRGDLARPELGVFVTRSPDRPNPIGLHEVSVLAVDGLRIRVGPLEALDGTPLVDLKPVLSRVEDR